MLPVVVEKQGLGTSLAFIIAGARADRIDVTPVALRLRMNFRIAIHFGGRCLKNGNTQSLGQAQRIDSADDAGLERLHGSNW